LATLLRPLALLSHPVALRVWLGLNIGAFAMTMMILIRLFAVPRWLIAPVLGFGLVLPAVYDTWLLGQVGVLLTLLFVLMLVLSIAKTPRPWHAYAVGILLGIAIVIKIYPVFFGLVYLTHRRFRTIVATIGTVLGAFLIGIVFGGGWQNTATWFTTVLPAVSTLPPYPSNQSVRAAVARFFASHEFRVAVLNKDNYLTVRQNAVIESPPLLISVTLVLSLIVLALTVRAMWRPVGPDPRRTFILDFVLATLLSLLLTPVVWDVYFVHLVIPLVLLLRLAQVSPWYRLILLISLIFLALQRYGRYILIYTASPLVMICGLSSVIVLWLVFLHLRKTMVDPPDEPGSGSELPASPNRVGAL
jgi:alpha-1,2-mannosyltransferase